MPNNGPHLEKCLPTKPHIAVVDDDASFLRSVGRLLRTADYAVETFGSARQFLSSLPTSLPECLVLDVHVPEMTGLQLQGRLADQGYCAPVIFVTAYDTPQTRAQARQAGAFGLLLKALRQGDALAGDSGCAQCQPRGAGEHAEGQAPLDR